MNIVYIVCAVGGFALLIGGLVVDDLFESVDLGPDWLSVPVVGAALGAFGVAGWAGAAAGAAAGVAIVVALVVGLVFAVATVWFVAQVSDGRTDATPRGSDLQGLEGKVVTPVAGGRGEVLVRLGGQLRKLTALSGQDMELGTRIVVVESISDSSVRVMERNDFWGADPGGPGSEGEVTS